MFFKTKYYFYLLNKTMLYEIFIGKNLFLNKMIKINIKEFFSMLHKQ